MFFSKQKKGQTILTIDIGSSSVGAALVSVTENESPKIVFCTRSPIALLSEAERSHSVASTVQALELTMEAVIKQHTPFDKSHIIFSSPWCTSETKFLKVEKDALFQVAKHDIEKLTQQAEEEYLKGSSVVSEIIEHKIIRIRLNGYDTPNPYNKKAKTVEVAFFASIVQKDILESVRRVVEKHFHVRRNEMSSFSLAVFGAMSGIMPNEHNFLIVDVRGEVTDLSSVVDGALTKNLSFSPGKTALIKAVSDGSGNSLPASLFLVSATFEDKVLPTTQDKVMESAEKFKKIWIDSFNNAILEIYGRPSVPETIFLISDLDVEVFFDKMFAELNQNQTVHLLKNLNVKNFLDKNSVPTDQFLALESIFVTMI